MRNPVKIIAGISLLAITLAITTAILLVRVLDPNTFKGPLTALITRSTGLTTQIQGNMTFSLWPHIELNFNDIRFTSPSLPGNQHRIRAEKTTLIINIWPLFSGRYDIRAVEIHGLQLTLSRDSNATSSWLTPETTNVTPFFPGTAEKQRGATKASALTMRHLKSVNISNATLTCEDQHKKKTFVLDQVNLNLRTLVHGRNADLQMHGRYRSAASDRTALLNIGGTCILSMDGRELLFQQFQADMRLKGTGIPGDTTNATLTGTLVLQPHQKKTLFRALKAQLPDMDLFTSSTLQWANPSWEGGLIMNTNPQKITQLITGRNSLPGLRQIPRSLDLRTHFKAVPGNMSIKSFHALIDGQTLTGKGRVSQFALPKITFKLAADHLDLTKYLALPPKTRAPAPNEAPFIPPFLKTLRLYGSVTANAITWKDITTSTASATFRAQKGILRIYPLNIRLFDGRATGNIRTDLGGNRPVTRIRTNLKNLRILTTGNENSNGTSIQGSFTSYVDVTGQGALWAMDQSSLNGTVSLHVTNGTLQGMNLHQPEHERDRTQRFPTFPKVLPFTSLSAQGTLFAGTVSVQDVDLHAEHLHLKGTGTYDLAADHLLGKIRVADADNTWRILRISGSVHQPAITIQKSSGPQQKPVHSIPHGPASSRTMP